MQSDLILELDYFSLHVKNLFKYDPLILMNMAKFQITFYVLLVYHELIGNVVIQFKKSVF
jgi:hypothetical protein